ncbi:phage regulatory CII family protein [Erwinia psidii]|uniref:Phage regulatory CII family protein n=1 Tax=Erwinia psidii TaxID=69224 RepID=A0A3N6ULM4_9GAMM|nr:phage regulatory CII family protein [Erwinia psidii]MCX8962733.1 phage regulatory CII family protein [Erwinia psidii]RQM36829.1 phage regulatory CII family protein [Erwinia psidii]
MFDYQVSKQPHFDTACKNFASRHNLRELADKLGMNHQTLRNKLNPDQVHQLTAMEIAAITDITEDATLIDGLLAQMKCMPAVPLNEVKAERMTHYVLQATSEIGKVAAAAVSGQKLTASGKSAFMENINAGIRCLSLVGLSVQTRVHSSPALANTVDVISGLSASIGLS